MIAEKSFSDTSFRRKETHEDSTACFGDVDRVVRQPAAAYDSNQRQDHYNGKPKQRES